MTEAVHWHCPTCHRPVVTPFCPQCGEEPHRPQELTLRGIGEKVLHAFTSIDARVAQTALHLLRSPGQLTVAWMSGQRKPYVAPFQLFLVANVLFFTLQWLTGTNIFSSTLDSHLHHQDWSELATALLTQRLARTGVSLAQYAPEFDRAVVLNAKSLIVLMTVPFALLLPIVFMRERRPFMTHVVFSLHLYTFLLLLFCLALLAAKASALLGTRGLETPWVDDVLTALNLLACAVYLYLAIAAVYRASGALRVIATVVLALCVGLIVVGYRFAMFLLTLYATS